MLCSTYSLIFAKNLHRNLESPLLVLHTTILCIPKNISIAMTTNTDTTSPEKNMPPLLAKLPPAGTTDSDVILEAFLDAVADKNLSLYPAQEEALLEIVAGKHVVLATPTGSGKSLVALGMHFKAMSEGKTSYYTAPIKALVSEKFFSLCEEFGAPYVGMMTGDASINRSAPIICCTAEILANLALREGAQAKVDYAIMDEFHYYGDKERGMAWQLPLLTMPNTTFLLMSATLGEMGKITKGLEEYSQRPVAQIYSAQRPVPLSYEYRETPIHETIEELVASNRAPVYVVNFTQRACAEQAQNLMSANFSTKEQKAKIAAALQDFRFDTPYGKEIQRFIRHGLGVHHAGLLPKYRLLVEQLAQQGLLKVISGTDTLGVGVNIPIRTVLFTALSKYDGNGTNILRARDFHQIAGRAGRKGFDDQGTVVCQAPEHVIENKRLEMRAAGDLKKNKKIVKRAPEPGFVGWDQNTFEKLIQRQPEELQSRMQINHGMLLNLLQGSSMAGSENVGGGIEGYRRLVDIIMRSHETDINKTKLLVNAKLLFKSLREAGIIHVVKNHGSRHEIRVSEVLQSDFSMHQTLSLYLLDAIFALDPVSETYALDLLTIVESILENPQMVLQKQLDKVKREALAEMKAQGIEYEERMNRLDSLDYPKPNADFIYQTFNAFAVKHPWVKQQGENIRPKSVGRDMVERYASFHDYIREYGLERSEGVLLRYVSDVYKAVAQSVPADKKDEKFLDIEAFFRTMLARVDSSLIEEWESMLHPTSAPTPANPTAATKLAPQGPKAWDKRTAVSRIKAAMHRFIKSLGDRDVEEAAVLLVKYANPLNRHGVENWDMKKIDELMQPYWSSYKSLDTTPKSRSNEYITVETTGLYTYHVRQVLLDPEENHDWYVEAVVDLAEISSADDPLLQLIYLGD